MAYTALEKMQRQNQLRFGRDVGPAQPALRVDDPEGLDLKSSALRFLHERCEGLRFDRRIEEEEERTGVLRGKSLKPGQIPYNMQMDINRLCLERELEAFIDSGATRDAYNVYYCFLEIFLGSYGDTKKMIELLSEYEANGSSLLMDHRDHYSHSVYVFVLGLAIYETNAGFRKAFRDFYRLGSEDGGEDGTIPEGDASPEDVTSTEGGGASGDGGASDAANLFLEFWGLTSLFHDIGYPFELVFEQVMDYFEADGGDRGINNPFIAYKNMESITRIDPQTQKRLEELYGRSFRTVNELLAFDITQKLGRAYGFSEEYLLDVLERKAVSPEDFGYYMDHGYFSALRLFRTLEDVMGAGPALRFRRGHVDALGAILLHYVLYAYSIGFCDEGTKPKLSMQLHPLAWLLILCDELQCWDRIAYGRNSRNRLHPMSAEFSFRNNGLIAGYFFDEEEHEKIDHYLSAYTEWKLGGKATDAPKLKAYSDMAGEKKTFIRNIEKLVDLSGIPLKVVCATAPVDRSRKRLYLSGSNFMHLHDFAVALNARSAHEEDEDDVDPSVLEEEFATLSLEYKISNINQVKSFGRYLNAIQCFYTDRPVDFDMHTEFTPEQIGVFAPMEHERWIREHQSMGWRRGDIYERAPFPGDAGGRDGERNDGGAAENAWRGALREQTRCHRLAMDGEPTKAQILDHYHALPECERSKDWVHFNRMLKLIRKFYGLRIYRL